MKKFIDLPWSIYKDFPLWIPPIKSSVAKLLDRKKHPFWQFSEGEFFLAERDGKVVGRIAAIIDGNNNAYHSETFGAWGFFECFQDHEAACGLFEAVEQWVRERGMSAIRGPLNPSTNYEVGLLVDGFAKEPALMMPYNPAYYLDLIYGVGYRKEKDLFSYRFTRDHEAPKWMFEVSQRICEKNDITIHCPKKWKRDDIRLLCNIYKECWAENWGFVPTTEREDDELAKDLLFLIEPELAFFIYYSGEPVGIGVLLPDLNPLLKRLNGNLGISALIKKYLYQSEIKGLRGLLFGVKNNYRQLGLHLVSLEHVMKVLRATDKYEYTEMGWTLEDNEAINRLFSEGGLAPDKRYRIYQKEL
ncbi:MAG: acyl-CoA N-acyltransferase [Proteobacteria bacterium]|nr:acyl-CoA N-acyltransferase [Pseudomonadota bacterium]